MLIVMNVVQVCEDRREAFERAFLERESHVHEAPGFAGFELLRRDRDGEYISPPPPPSTSPAPPTRAPSSEHGRPIGTLYRLADGRTVIVRPPRAPR